jgi:hypothetical protein
MMVVSIKLDHKLASIHCISLMDPGLIRIVKDKFLMLRANRRGGVHDIGRERDEGHGDSYSVFITSSE